MRNVRFFKAICFFFMVIAAGKIQSESLSDIDQEIMRLKQELQTYEDQEMNDLTEAQGLMIADWKKYGQEMQEIKKEQDKIEQIKKQILDLEKQKDALNAKR